MRRWFMASILALVVSPLVYAGSKPVEMGENPGLIPEVSPEVKLKDVNKVNDNTPNDFLMGAALSPASTDISGDAYQPARLTNLPDSFQASGEGAALVKFSAKDNTYSLNYKDLQTKGGAGLKLTSSAAEYFSRFFTLALTHSGDAGAKAQLTFKDKDGNQNAFTVQLEKATRNFTLDLDDLSNADIEFDRFQIKELTIEVNKDISPASGGKLDIKFNLSTAPYDITQITTAERIDERPHSNANGDLVWLGIENSKLYVFYYDHTAIKKIDQSEGAQDVSISNGRTIVWNASGNVYEYKDGLITNLGQGGGIKISETGKIIWFDNAQLHYFDGSAWSNFSRDSGFIGSVSFCFNGNYAAWSLNDEIYLFNGSTIQRITNNSVADGAPAVNGNGDIAWIENVANTNQIFLYKNGITKQISSSKTKTVSFPSINDAGQVAWIRNSGSPQAQAYYYDGVMERQVSSGNHSASQAVIGNDGHVYWIAYSNLLSFEIFAYDGQRITQLTDLRSRAVNMAANSLGNLVFQYSIPYLNGFPTNEEILFIKAVS